MACVLLLLFVWRIQELHPIIGKLKVPIMATGVGILLFILDKKAIRATKVLQHPVFYSCLALLGLMVLGIPFSLYPGASFSFVATDHSRTLLNMILIATAIQDRGDARRVVYTLVLGGVWYSLLVMMFGLEWEQFAYYDRNDVALMLTVAMPFLVYLGVGTRRWTVRIALVCFAALFIVVIVMTGSRGGMLAVVGICLGFLFLMGGIPTRFRTSLLVVFGVGLAVGGQFAGDGQRTGTYWERMATILKPQEDYNWAGGAESGRMEVWKRGVGYMVDRPILGVGARAFQSAEGTLSEQARRGQPGFKWSVAHNAYVEIGTELGVGGLLVFLYRFQSMFGLLRKGDRKIRGRKRAHKEIRLLGQAISVGLVGFAVASIFLSQQYSVILHVLIAFTLAYPMVVRSGAAAVPRMPRSASSAHEDHGHRSPQLRMG